MNLKKIITGFNVFDMLAGFILAIIFCTALLLVDKEVCQETTVDPYSNLSNEISIQSDRLDLIESRVDIRLKIMKMKISELQGLTRPNLTFDKVEYLSLYSMDGELVISTKDDKPWKINKRRKGGDDKHDNNDNPK